MTWPPVQQPQRDDRGETLIELVVAVAILGIAGVAILGGLMMSVRSSVIHRNEASGGAYVRSFAEAIQTYVDANGYKPAPTAASTYQVVAVTDLPTGYTKVGDGRAVLERIGMGWVHGRRHPAARPHGHDHRATTSTRRTRR